MGGSRPSRRELTVRLCDLQTSRLGAGASIDQRVLASIPAEDIDAFALADAHGATLPRYSRPVSGSERQAEIARAPLGVGSLAANVVVHAARLTVALAREMHDGGSAAQAQRIAARADALSVANDIAFAAATGQLAASSSGQGDGFLLAVSLGEAAEAPRVIAEAASDLASLAADLALAGDGTRRADYLGIARLSAAAAEASALLVRANLAVGEDDWRLRAATVAAAQASDAAERAAAGVS